MRAERSGSQILHGYLPGQTVDLQGGVWKVDEWRSPHFVRADVDRLRREIVRLARPWEVTGKDKKFVARLREGRPLRVHSLDLQNGVMVKPFPKVWQCRTCNRLATAKKSTCKCGASNWGQLPFVGYHGCGMIEDPYIPKCNTHNDVKVVFPGSSDARQIKFQCPVCNVVLRQGFGFRKCECGDGTISFNVHRAASVFTPRSVAVVNAPSEELREALRAAGGADRALSWVLAGMAAGGIQAAAPDASSLIANLIDQGFDQETAEAMAAVAKKGKRTVTDIDLDSLGSNKQLALDQAVTIYNATAKSRQRVADLIEMTPETSALGMRYRSKYLTRLGRAGLTEVELSESFPVLSGYFGYTRGDQTPGASRLMTWRDQRTTSYVVYGELQETEALLFRLAPVRVADWLRNRGHELPPTPDELTARMEILKAASIPDQGTEVDHPTLGSDLLTLIHSMSHRMIRHAAVLAGIDRNGLAELLVPGHLAFFLYAGARGDFVLGGLQAVFETELDRLLESFVRGEHRCALDPGCTKTGGACVACLHVGEPSCRFFNRFLDRRALFGKDGYISTPR
jgi:hypothetical protein